MSANDCQQVIDSYLEWLRTEIEAEKVGDYCELTTPFLDHHNDYLQFYVRRDNGKIMLTDDGFILSDLHASGVDMRSPKRKETLNTFLRGLGVKEIEGKLVGEASDKNLGQKVHNFIQAMVSVNDMFMLAQSKVASLFLEDVRNYLDEHEVRYSERVKLSGLSGFDHSIDFLIPKSKTSPERFVQAINSPNKQNIGLYLFGLKDVLEERQGETRAYAFLNDQQKTASGDIVEALENYGVKSVIWSERGKAKAELVS